MPINPKYLAKFESEGYCHIFNRSNSGRLMFTNDAHYTYFLTLMKRYLSPYFNFYAYCLLPNHFHLFLQVKKDAFEESIVNDACVKQFTYLFVTYTLSLNKESNNHGGIFSTPFRRVSVKDDHQFSQLMYYIHCNPVHHNIANSCTDYKQSSYSSFLSSQPTLLLRDEVLDWFGGLIKFKEYHCLFDGHYTSKAWLIE